MFISKLYNISVISICCFIARLGGNLNMSIIKHLVNKSKQDAFPLFNVILKKWSSKRSFS